MFFSVLVLGHFHAMEAPMSFEMDRPETNGINTVPQADHAFLDLTSKIPEVHAVYNKLSRKYSAAELGECLPMYNPSTAKCQELKQTMSKFTSDTDFAAYPEVARDVVNYVVDNSQSLDLTEPSSADPEDVRVAGRELLALNSISITACSSSRNKLHKRRLFSSCTALVGAGGAVAGTALLAIKLVAQVSALLTNSALVLTILTYVVAGFAIVWGLGSCVYLCCFVDHRY